MTKKLTRWIVAAIAVFMTFALLLGVGGGLLGSGITAGAATEAHESGWYVVGNGAGTLKNCSWTSYVPAFRLEGTESGSDAIGSNYLGTWTSEPLLLYEGDEFKFVYNNGSWDSPDETDWSYGLYAGVFSLRSNDSRSFNSGWFNNFLVSVNGYYTFTLYVYRNEAGNISVQSSYTLVSTDTPAVDLYQMYVVGRIADLPNCRWPSETSASVSSYGVPMAYDEAYATYSVKVFLTPSDQFKVYNAANHGYIPEGVSDNLTVPSSGYYVISCPKYSRNDVRVTPADRYVPYASYHREAGWYIVGNGAGTLKNDDWNQFLIDYRLSGMEFAGSFSNFENYLGIWNTSSMLLYEGDQFKFVYDKSNWGYPNNTGWYHNYVGDFYDMTGITNNAFTNAANGNIQVNVSGYYTFYVYVVRQNANTAQIIITYTLDSLTVPEIDLFDMYVVGSIESVGSGWPDSVDVAQKCIHMTYNSYDGKWYSPVVYLTPDDAFKVYNLVNNIYYPSGFAQDNLTVAQEGWYMIQWEKLSQTVNIIAV